MKAQAHPEALRDYRAALALQVRGTLTALQRTHSRAALALQVRGTLTALQRTHSRAALALQPGHPGLAKLCKEAEAAAARGGARARGGGGGGGDRSSSCRAWRRVRGVSGVRGGEKGERGGGAVIEAAGRLCSATARRGANATHMPNAKRQRPTVRRATSAAAGRCRLPHAAVWAVGGGRWAVGGGRWAVGGGRWAVVAASGEPPATRAANNERKCQSQAEPRAKSYLRATSAESCNECECRSGLWGVGHGHAACLLVHIGAHQNQRSEVCNWCTGVG
jgi:hypothetical protein